MSESHDIAANPQSKTNTIVQTPTIVGSSSSSVPGQPAEDTRIGTNLGKYEIRSLLGRGGMGAVYRGFDPIIEREVAIKVLSEAFSGEPGSLRRFIAEARAAGKLNHYNTIAIYDIGAADGIHYIVMELATGGSVAERVAANPRLPLADACRIIAEAGDGLAAAHRVGLIHRDIKPENMMLTADGAVKIVDFGLSRSTETDVDAKTVANLASQIAGTPQYMSPEQFTGAPLDERTDIYSLGMTFYVVLTGQLPFQDALSLTQVMYAQLHKECPDPRQLRPELPEGCARVISKATAKSPSNRYENAKQMVADVERLIASAGGEHAPLLATSTPTAADAPRARLPNVLIVEPSKLQALILRDTFLRAGAASVRVTSSAQEALEGVKTEVPNVLITSRQLPDGIGDKLIGKLQSNPALRETMCVLTSSDLRLRDVVDVIGPTMRAFASKNSKPDEIVRAVYAATDIDFPKTGWAVPSGRSDKRILLVYNFQAPPPQLAQTLRSGGALDVRTMSYQEFLAADGPKIQADLAMCVRHSMSGTAHAPAGDLCAGGDFGSLLDKFETLDESVPHTVVVLESLGGIFTLQCVRRSGFNVSCACRFDEARFARLMRIL